VMLPAVGSSDAGSGNAHRQTPLLICHERSVAYVRRPDELLPGVGLLLEIEMSKANGHELGMLESRIVVTVIGSRGLL
jgi:hypothetical protein